MACFDSYTNDSPVEGVCPDCGGEVDADGDTTEARCHYSPVICKECGYAPCDDSC